MSTWEITTRCCNAISAMIKQINYRHKIPPSLQKKNQFDMNELYKKVVFINKVYVCIKHIKDPHWLSSYQNI